MPETVVYVYCLIEASRRPTRQAMTRMPRGLPGASTKTPKLLEIDEKLWALASDVPLSIYSSSQLEERLWDINWVADIAVAHESVVEHFAGGRGTTVVPMKLFTMFSSLER